MQIYSLLSFENTDHKFFKELEHEIHSNLESNLSYIEDSKTKSVSKHKDNFDVYLRTPILGVDKGIHKHRGQKIPVKFFVFDFDYDAFRKFDALFSNYCHRTAKIEFDGKSYSPIKSVFFYILPITSDTSKDVEWFLSRFKANIDETTKEILAEQIRQHNETQDLTRKIRTGEILLNKAEIRSELILNPKMESRDYQQQFLTLLSHKKRILNGDYMAAGKSFQAAMAGLLPDSLPALIVVPKQIDLQWEAELTKKYFLNAKVQIITKGDFSKKLKTDCHFYICSYTLLSKIPEMMKACGVELKTLIGDEIEQIRNTDTDKSITFGTISEFVNYCIGLTGTPIGKKGFDIWSILSRINKNNSLGPAQLFKEQFCDGQENAKNPQELREYLIKNGEMISRTKSELGLDKILKIDKDVLISGSLAELESHNDVLVKLAMGVLSLDYSDDSMIKEFDFKLRQATGIAKAKSVAQLAKIYLDAGRKVIITGWYRDFWDILERELRAYCPAYITGTELGNKKHLEKERFINEDSCKVLFLSHSSSSGIDGLEKVCFTIIHGEYPWLVKDIEQLNSRLIRNGQGEIVEALYPHIDDGSDPPMRQLHQKQAVQLAGLMGASVVEYVDGNSLGDNQSQEDYDELRRELLKNAAREILKSKGIEYVEKVSFTPFHKKISNILKNVIVRTGDEKKLQEILDVVLREKLEFGIKIEREVQISKRSILDFRITSPEGESVVIECKTTDRGKKSAYHQVERYIEELNHDSTILFVPWEGIKDIYIGNHKVEVLNYGLNARREAA